MRYVMLSSLAIVFVLVAGIALAQPPGGEGPPPNDDQFGPPGDFFDPPPGFPPDGFGPPGGFGPGGGFGPPGGGFGPPGGGEERKVVKEYDKNDDGWLNADEREVARKAIAAAPGEGGRRGPGGGRPGGPGGPGGGRGPGFGPGGPGGPGFGPGGPGGPGFGPGGPGGFRETGKPGPKVAPEDVPSHEGEPLYAENVLRTIFLEFENEDWEAELEEFHGTDVDVPATAQVDGKLYPNVGVHFRGMSSYGMIPRGSKRSLNVSFDLADADQRIGGYKTLNLLNANGDPSMMKAVLFSHVARQYTPTPKATFVEVVINGESWGVYESVQQFDKVFLQENYQSKGTRWKAPGSPGGRSGLEYLGDDVEDYRRRFEIKSDDDPEAWKALMELCRTLNETPAEELEEALRPMLDVEEVLWFLALDNALVNEDGYWVRASDYNLFLDEAGVFHVVPHDMNETFHAGRGPGGPGGPPPGGRFGGRGQERPRPEGDERRPPGPEGAPERTAGEPGPFPPGGAEFPGGPGFPQPGFRGPGGRGPGGRGPGGPGGPMGGGGVELDPLVGMDDATKPLRSKLLAVPKFRERYLRNVREIAETWLDWKNLGPVVARYAELIEDDVEADTRKLASFTAFDSAVGGRSREAKGELYEFAKKRREYLLSYPAIKELPDDER